LAQVHCFLTAMAFLIQGIQTLIQAPYRAVMQEAVSEMSFNAKMCAKISEASYDPPAQRKGSITVSWKNSQITLYLDRNIAHTEYCVYKTDSIAILGFKGTDNAKDGVVDGGIFAAGIFSGHSGALTFTAHNEAKQLFLRSYGGHQKYVTGHSLGGAYAVKAAEEMPDITEVHVFNSAPIEGIPHNTTYTHHHIFSDPVSMMTGNQMGVEKLYGGWSTTTYSMHENASNRHSLSNFTQ